MSRVARGWRRRIAIVLVTSGLGPAALWTAALAEVVSLRGATLHPISGPDIAGGTLVIDGAKIASLGAGIEPPAGSRSIDLTGLHVYPGLIDANTILGLVEIGSVRGTVDVSETGDVNPNARAEVALNADSELLPVARAGGVLVAMACPRGGVIAGTAAAFQLDGWNWEDLTLRAPVGLLVNWPNMRIDREPRSTPSADEVIARRDARVRALRDAFANARSYQTAHGAAGKGGVPAHDRDPRWEAMLPVLRGEIPVMVAADDILEIRAALRWAEEEGVKLVFLSGGDIALVADELARRKIPVVLDPTWALPGRRWQPFDDPMTIASRLHAAGVQFAFSTGSGTFGAANARNLPFEAAAAVAYGLPKDVALRAITQTPAEILGLGSRLGTLEPGKDATLIVTDGDPLDIRSHVLHAFIAGREMSLDNRQSRLYEKYRSRPRPATPPPK
jgi:imidazolonepropionase-like amidohydrolase